MDEEKYIWVVRENSDKTEGRGKIVDVAVCESEDQAYEVNRNICGPMGHPRHFGGEIYKIKLGSYPLEEELVWGYRLDWLGTWGSGWLDLRDKPDEKDPEWIEYLRLCKKFVPSFSEEE